MLKSAIKTALKLFHSHEKVYPDIFIFTLGRSGSTLLAEILNAQSSIKLCSEPFVLQQPNLGVVSATSQRETPGIGPESASRPNHVLAE